jgi:hypothetical protein
MSRTQLVHALTDLFGYSVSDFNNQTVSDIWWYSTPQEQTAVKEYIKVQKCLVNF